MVVAPTDQFLTTERLDICGIVEGEMRVGVRRESRKGIYKGDARRYERSVDDLRKGAYCKRRMFFSESATTMLSVWFSIK